ncbi:sigma-70 family RNA polymerase sigma factor [Streptomyces sp. NPDC058045]|uniref:sigma-70 family RNA polymerase sigma factor n=1 Tax=Streptomyces sp. NPDC058045 TaxID=3346311 RepID=UPI0036ED949D
MTTITAAAGTGKREPATGRTGFTPGRRPALGHRSAPRRTLPAAALAELQREHAGPLFALLLRLSDGDRQRAEDLLQETFVRAWQHPEVLDGPGPAGCTSVRPWLFTVGRRLAIDARRARQARPAEVGDTAALEHTRVCADHAERSAAGIDVRAAVMTLTPEHRAVLVQVYFRGASVAQAARALGIPPGTVKSRAYYALRALRHALPGYAPDLR